MPRDAASGRFVSAGSTPSSTHDLKAALDNFNRKVAQFVEVTVPKQLVLFQKKISLEGLSRIVMRTPVRTGRARGNWQTTVGAFPTTPLNETDQSGNLTISRGASALERLEPFDVVYITNNVDYIIHLEEGRPGAGSPQAPNGMVAVTVNELSLMFP